MGKGESSIYHICLMANRAPCEIHLTRCSEKIFMKHLQALNQSIVVRVSAGNCSGCEGMVGH